MAVPALCLTGPVLWLSAPALCAAQQSLKTARIGILVPATVIEYAARLEHLRAGLREAGLIEGRHYFFEFREAGGKAEKLPELAAELVVIQ